MRKINFIFFNLITGLLLIQMLSDQNFTYRNNQNSIGGCSHCVMVKEIDCGIVVSEFVLQSRYHVHFRVNTSGKGMNLLILPAMG